jgi:iron complex transport system permease protein
MSVLKRTILVGSALGGALLLVILVSLLMGTTMTEIGSAQTWTIILSYRLPRTLLAAVVGAGLASAGVVFQGVLRNPLADPYLIGIAAGGALGAVASIALFGGGGFFSSSFCAFAGSLTAVGLVYSLAPAGGRVNAVILAGVIVGALMNAIMLLIMALACADEKQRIIFWLMGDFSLADYGQVAFAAVIVTIGGSLMFLNANRLNLLTAGDEAAASLGVDVWAARTVFMAVAAMVTAAVVSVSGTIGFVGLVVPHALRMVIGPDNRVLLPAAFLGGAAFLAASDCAARVIAYPVELPVGVVTTLAGAPFFLYLLVKRQGR